jgi:hypothetical protein
MSGEGQAVWREGAAPLSVRGWKGCGRWLGRWLRPLGPVVLVGVALVVAGFWLGRWQDAQRRLSQQVPRPHYHFLQLPPFFHNGQDNLVCTFTVQNTTNRVIHIDKIHHSCACAAAQLEQHDLAPGEQTRLHLHLNLAGPGVPNGSPVLLKSLMKLFHGSMYVK